VLAVILACKWPNAYTLTLAIVTGFYVAGEALNILYIKRKAKRDPQFLEEKIT